MMQKMAHCPRNGWKVRPLWLGLTLPVAAAGILILLLLLFVGAASHSVNAARSAPGPALPQALVTLVKSAGPSLVAPEQTLVYTLTVTNISTTSTVSLLVTDTVPANTTYQGANFLYPSGGGAWIPPLGGTGVITWIPNDQLGPGGYLQLQLVVRVAAGLSNGTIITNAAYGVSEQSGVVMGTPVTVTVQAPALAIGKLADRFQVCGNERIGYTLAVTNVGRLTTNGPITVVERVPTYTVYAASSSPSVFDAASGLITWTLATALAPSQAVTVTFAVTNPASTPYGTPVVNVIYSASAPDAPGVATGTPVTVTAINLQAGFTNTTPVWAGQPVTFYNTSSGATGYTWNFGDGSLLDTQTHPAHTFANAGSFAVVLTATGSCGTAVAMQTLSVISSTVPPTMTLVVVPGTLLVAQSATLTATVWDQYGQPQAGQMVNFSTTDPLGLGGIIPSSVTTGSGGQATAVISSTQPGVKRVTATAGGQSATTPVTFTVAPGQPYTVTLTIVPGTLLITQTAHLLATVTDQNGSPLSGQVITFSSPNDFGTLLFSAIVPLTGTTGVNGQVTAMVSSLLGGDKLVIATASNGVTGMAHVNFQGTCRLFLPAVLNAYHAPATCAPQALYTFSSVGYGPSGMAYDPATDRLFITNRDGPDGGSLAVVNAQSGALIRLVTGLLSAHDVAYDAVRRLIYVVGWDWLFVVDGSTYAVTRTITLGTNMDAFGVAYNPANSKLYVSGFSNRTIVIVDVATWSILRTIADSRAFPISDPTYIAVNPNNNKAYVVNHTGGPSGWLVVLDGATNEARQVVPAPDADHGGDFYGIAVDSVHNRVYVTSISQAYLYAIDSATDTPSPWVVKIVRASNPPGRQVPLRMVAVNPNVGGLTHLWLTSVGSSEPEDFWGMDRLMLLSFDSWPPASPVPMATAVASSPMYGLTLDPGTGLVFASNVNSNLVTVSQDMATLCSTPLSLSASNADAASEGWTVIVEDYGSPPTER